MNTAQQNLQNEWSINVLAQKEVGFSIFLVLRFVIYNVSPLHALHMFLGCAMLLVKYLSDRIIQDPSAKVGYNSPHPPRALRALLCLRQSQRAG